MEDVGQQGTRALPVERRALADPETVLLVDDCDGERAELDRLLDQGVGPDHDRRPAGGQGAEQLRAPGVRAWPR